MNSDLKNIEFNMGTELGAHIKSRWRERRRLNKTLCSMGAALGIGSLMGLHKDTEAGKHVGSWNHGGHFVSHNRRCLPANTFAVLCLSCNAH